MMLMGHGADVAIASTRLGALGLWIAALKKYHKAGAIDLKLSLQLTPLALLGGYLGSIFLLELDKEVLDSAVAVIILAMLPITYIYKQVAGTNYTPGPVVRAVGYPLFFFVITFGGFFSGGDGTLGIYVLAICFGKTIIEANATRALPWLCMGTVASANYLLSGLVNYELAATIFIGMATGSYFGAGMALKKGEDWVRRIFAAVVLLIVCKLLFT